MTNDSSNVFGIVCLAGILPGPAGAYSVQEITPPSGYGATTSTNPQPSGAIGAGTCASPSETFTFLNPPLGEFQIIYTDLGSGETNARISCTEDPTGAGPTDILPSPDDTTPNAFDDLDETYTDLPGADPALTYTCTIEIDP